MYFQEQGMVAPESRLGSGGLAAVPGLPGRIVHMLYLVCGLWGLIPLLVVPLLMLPELPLQAADPPLVLGLQGAHPHLQLCLLLLQGAALLLPLLILLCELLFCTWWNRKRSSLAESAH